MAWNPTPTRGFSTFSSHTSGSGVSSTGTTRFVHRDRSIVHRKPSTLWRAGSSGAGHLEGVRDLEQPTLGRATGPTSWRPTGQPSGVKPAGTEIAGQPVTVMRYADRIQSR